MPASIVLNVVCPAEGKTLGYIECEPRTRLTAAWLRRYFRPASSMGRVLMNRAADGSVLHCPTCENAVLLALPDVADLDVVRRDDVRLLVGLTTVSPDVASMRPPKPRERGALQAEPVTTPVKG